MTNANRHPHARKDKDALTTTSLRECTEGSPLRVSNVDPAERSRRIEEAAYYRAERRGFCPGCEIEDWQEAEREIDEQLRVDADGGASISALGGVSPSAALR